MQLDATLTVGTDGSGQDVVLYSGTSGDNSLGMQVRKR